MVVEAVELGLFQALSKPAVIACSSLCHCNYARFSDNCWENLSCFEI